MVLDIRGEIKLSSFFVWATIDTCLINNLTKASSYKQFRTFTGHSSDSIGRTPDFTILYFFYNYSCNKDPDMNRMQNSTLALVRNRARMLTISYLIIFSDMWFGIPSLLRIFVVGRAPSLSCAQCMVPGIPASRKREERNEWDTGDIL
jgi:hypothetical protein